MHSMDTYPYLTELPSKFDIVQIIQNCLNCTVLNIQEIGENILDYKLWKSTQTMESTFFYYFDIINTTNIWNPYSTEEYVLTKGERIHTLLEAIENDKKLPVIYKNTACGYVVYNGSLYDVILRKRNI